MVLEHEIVLFMKIHEDFQDTEFMNMTVHRVHEQFKSDSWTWIGPIHETTRFKNIPWTQYSWSVLYEHFMNTTDE